MKTLRYAAAVVGTATVGALLVASCGGAQMSDGLGATLRTDGPMLPLKVHGYQTFAEPGQTFTDGWERLELDRTDGPAAEIGSIKLLGTDGTMSLAGALLALPDRRVGSIQVSPDWPPTRPGLGTLIEAEGASVAPDPSGVGYVLQLGLTAQEPIAYRRGVRVTYEVEDETYTYDSHGVVVSCSADVEAEKCESLYRSLVSEATEAHS